MDTLASANRGKYVVFEGPDGVGKSTQIEYAKEFLEEHNIEYLVIKEPGDEKCPPNPKIREILLSDSYSLDPYTELALFSADRSNLTRKIIRPSLAQGVSVISDRNYISSNSYQGYAGGIPIEKIAEITDFFTGYEYINPDMVILLIPDSVEDILNRAEKRGSLDRIEQKGTEYHQQVIEGYRKLAASKLGYVAINASQPINDVRLDVRSVLTQVFIER